jgi:hypothetical protein
MAQDNTLVRSLHDLGLAAWFGGSLMGAVGLNGAAADVDQPAQRLRVANTILGLVLALTAGCLEAAAIARQLDGTAT